MRNAQLPRRPDAERQGLAGLQFEAAHGACRCAQYGLARADQSCRNGDSVVHDVLKKYALHVSDVGESSPDWAVQSNDIELRY